MAARYFFDIETNGLLPQLSEIHSIVLKDVDTEDTFSFHDHYNMGSMTIETALGALAEADEIIGHNIIDFDIPAIQKVFQDWKPPKLVTDTLTMSRLVYPDLKERDFKRHKKTKGTADAFPGHLIGSHGLKAWGIRLEKLKGDYSQEMKEKGLDPWASWNQSMQDYCIQDVEVTSAFWDLMMGHNPTEESIRLEHDVRRIVTRQELRGFAFNKNRAATLYKKLNERRAIIEDELRETFPPWEVKTPFTPKVNNSKLGYKKGVTTQKVKEITFNPRSRDHIANRLTALYGWRPKEYTNSGKPQVDDKILGQLKYPPIPKLSEYLIVEKRLGQLAEGTQAWLKKEKKGRIYGRVNTNGAVTGRMTHRSPNLAQVPAKYAPYGPECRALFKAGKGYRLVGCDAAGLELRCLAGYLAIFDGGEYVDVVLRGKKEDGTDMHSRTAKALGLLPDKVYIFGGKRHSGREHAKTYFYALLYGAGDYKLGTLLGGKRIVGTKSRARLMRSLPALNKLETSVKARANRRGYLIGLDGRKLPVRHPHAALNTLLQSAGAVIMKKALVLLDERLQNPHHIHLVPGRDYEFVGNIHDEWQIEVLPKKASLVGAVAAESIKLAGEFYNFRCQLDGDFAIGDNWSETH